MKKLIILAVLLVASQVFAEGLLQQTENMKDIQGAAPNGYLSQVLTVNSTTIDMSSNLWWGMYAPTACKFRLLPTTAKAAYPAFTMPATTLTGFLVNKNTKFVNFSGCTSGELYRH